MRVRILSVAERDLEDAYQFYESQFPRLGVILYPLHHLPQKVSRMAPPVVVNLCTDSFVWNQNTLVIQKADRFVIADEEKDFIFSIASKRKESCNP